MNADQRTVDGQFAERALDRAGDSRREEMERQLEAVQRALRDKQDELRAAEQASARGTGLEAPQT